MFNHDIKMNPTGRNDYEIYFANGGDRTKVTLLKWMLQEVRCYDVMEIGGGKIQSSSWLINGGKDE